MGSARAPDPRDRMSRMIRRSRDACCVFYQGLSGSDKSSRQEAKEYRAGRIRRLRAVVVKRPLDAKTPGVLATGRSASYRRST
jgi:hypothetical protein